MNSGTSEQFTDVRRAAIAALGSSAATNFTQQINISAGDVGRQIRAAAPAGIAFTRHLYARSRSTNAYAGTGETSVAQEPIETVSGFAEFDAIKSDDRSIRACIERIRGMDTLPYAARLAARLDDLLEGYKEDMDGRVFSIDSLRSLVTFLQSVPELRYPSITLTRGGDFFLSWKQGRTHVFSAQFLRSKQVSFAIFKPNPGLVGQHDQFSGCTALTSINNIIRQFNVMEWAAA